MGKLFKILYDELAFAVLHFLNGYFDGIARQKFFHQFRPFDEAEGAAVEVVLVAHVVHFFQFLDAVEVEMIYQFAGSVGAILVDDGKGGGSNDVGNAQFLANGFDESCFAGSHFSVKGKDGIVAHRCNELAGGFMNLV